MVSVKTPQFGDSVFCFYCDVCSKPICSVAEGNVLFDMEQSLQRESKVFFAHKINCTDKLLAIKSFQSKDLSEFLESFFPKLRSK
jgi:hypothetical protein